jgi:thiol-disulfide isomerase/thioredoxin
MLERIIALSLFLILSYFLVRKFNSTKSITNRFLPFEINNLKPGLPTILYFWTEQCAQCNSVQKPAILKLKDEGNKFNFIAFNAVKDFELIKDLKIKTVPSTVILSSDKNIRFINSGYASSSVLKEQLNN